MNLGGPVWHASAGALGRRDVKPTILRAVALAAIGRVGDPTLGEWEEWTGVAYHIRRRLSAAEQEAVGPVVDIRGTPEAETRLAAVRRWLPGDWTEW